MASEIREVARRQLAVTGAAALSLRAVAREMGLTAPALYRYYDDRGSLLTALIVDAYGSVTDAMEAARDRQPRAKIAARLSAVSLSVAFRQWAVDRPHEFALDFGSPVPGYRAPEDGPTLEAGQRFGAVFQDLFAEAWGQAPWPVPPPQYRTAKLDALLAVAGTDGLAPGPTSMARRRARRRRGVRGRRLANRHRRTRPPAQPERAQLAVSRTIFQS